VLLWRLGSCRLPGADRLRPEQEWQSQHNAPGAERSAGAFYDKQGGLWFTKNGYNVVVAGGSTYVEKTARIIAGKL
jgi:hypothetical protein